MANKLVIQNNQPVVLPADLRSELTVVLCFGPLHGKAPLFTQVLSMYGATQEQIDILLRTPLCEIARVIQGKPKQIENSQLLTIGAKV